MDQVGQAIEKDLLQKMVCLGDCLQQLDQKGTTTRKFLQGLFQEVEHDQPSLEELHTKAQTLQGLFGQIDSLDQRLSTMLQE